MGYVANTAAMGIKLNDLRFKSEGNVDLRGFLSISEEVRAGYDNIVCMVYLDAELQKRS